MQLQRLLSLTRQAVDDYNLIEDGDKIAIGISGGKDSLTMLYALHGLMGFYPKKFEIMAITVDLGFSGFDLSAVRNLCEELSVPYVVVETEIGSILFDTRKESNPCSLCAKLRKGAFNKAAKEYGCNKVAYAHHKDDLIETALLSLLYEGRFYAYAPKTYLDRMNLWVIRPLLYVSESDIIGFKNRFQLPVCKNPCPADGKTKREYVKNLIKQLNTENQGVKERLFRAVVDGHIEGWPVRRKKGFDYE